MTKNKQRKGPKKKKKKRRINHYCSNLRTMIFQDSNPETALAWANEINWPLEPDPLTYSNVDVLIEIVDVVEWCLAQEFDIDRQDFLKKYGYWPRTWEEEQRALIFFKDYDVNRKNRIKDCIANKTQDLVKHNFENLGLDIA